MQCKSRLDHTATVTLEQFLKFCLCFNSHLRQKVFDKVISEEKAVSEQYAQERDAAERDAREKETKVLSLTRELDEAYEKIEDLETKRKVLQNELDELANNQVRFST